VLLICFLRKTKTITFLREMSSQQRQKKLPVHIVEQHNDVLPFIHRSIASKRLPFTNIPMLHFDSHPDLLLPTELKAKTVFEPQTLYNQLSIENWLLPLAFAGHVNHVTWVKPPWASQIQSSQQTFSIGKCTKSGHVRLTSKENYFMTDGLFQTETGLMDRSEVNLTVMDMVPQGWSQLDESYKPSGLSDSRFTIFPGSKQKDSKTQRPLEDETGGLKAKTGDAIGTDPATGADRLQDLLKDRPYILDVDLDFFSTMDPFRDLLKPEEEDALVGLYKFQTPKDQADDILLSFTKSRQLRLKQLSSLFSSLDAKWTDNPRVPSPGEVRELSVAELAGLEPSTLTWLTHDLESHIKLLAHTVIFEGKGRDKGHDLTFLVLHDYGCTLDDTPLPHHVSTKEQLEAMLGGFCSLMEGLPRPNIVTVARSSEDDYCPTHQVDHCQAAVLSCLDKLYGPLDISYGYG